MLWVLTKQEVMETYRMIFKVAKRLSRHSAVQFTSYVSALKMKEGGIHTDSIPSA